MTSLLPQTNNVAPANYAPANGEVQIGLSPETKSSLMAAGMTGVLGGTWFAKPKIDSGYKIIQLDKDKFELSVKKLADTELEKEAVAMLENLREDSGKAAEKEATRLFGEKTELTQKELLGRFKNKGQLEKYIEAWDKRAAGIINDIVGGLGENNNINTTEVTEAHLKKLEKLDKNFASKFKTAYPEKATIGDLITFLSNESQSLDGKCGKLKNLVRILNQAGDGEVVSKATARNATRQLFIDQRLDQIDACYEAIRGKLPKLRLAGAAKWFGIGLALSVASNMFFSLFTKK